ncbi:MAG: hypothetical protein ACJ71P_01895, partial [Nitrososphaeraceae archaeon]
GIIVASKLVDKIKESRNNEAQMLQQIKAIVSRMKKACKEQPRSAIRTEDDATDILCSFCKSNYSLGQKYCRRCEVYMYNDDGMFCPCCVMQLRLTPSSRKCKEILRKRKDNIMKVQ